MKWESDRAIESIFRGADTLERSALSQNPGNASGQRSPAQDDSARSLAFGTPQSADWRQADDDRAARAAARTTTAEFAASRAGLADLIGSTPGPPPAWSPAGPAPTSSLARLEQAERAASAATAQVASAAEDLQVRAPHNMDYRRTRWP